MGNPNLVLDFQNFELDFFHQWWYQLMKYRFSIKFDQEQSGMGNPNLVLDFQNFQLGIFHQKMGIFQN